MKSTTKSPAICLNMIVRNESHIIHEVLDSVAPYISSWVIVDTGSDDGTQDVVRNHMAGLGIPGELHEREWRNFGHNRSEALDLAQGHGDYIWIIDADDVVVGTPDFSNLTHDAYFLKCQSGIGCVYWRYQLFRDGMPWRYEGVVHEFAACGVRFSDTRLEGDYHINSRRLGHRSQDLQKYARDRDLLLAEVERQPNDSRTVFYLAQSYFDLHDYANARIWYTRRTEMAGWDEELFFAFLRVAETMQQVGEPWPEVQDAYLRAWEFRTTRAEPLYYLAFHARLGGRHRLAYLYAERAAKIPVPDDTIFVIGQIYAWCALDEQAVAASWIGKRPESFTLFRRLLARADVPEHARTRIAGSRDFVASDMVNAAAAYPSFLAHRLVPGRADCRVTVSLSAGPDVKVTEQTLNSFLNCCTDIDQVGRFIIVDAGIAGTDRAGLLAKYPFLEFSDESPRGELSAMGGTAGRFHLQLRQGWRFFAPEPLIGRLTAVFDAEPQVVQVGVNYADATALKGAIASLTDIRHAAGEERYVISEATPTGPAMIDTTRLNKADGLNATLDEVFCIT